VVDERKEVEYHRKKVSCGEKKSPIFGGGRGRPFTDLRKKKEGRERGCGPRGGGEIREETIGWRKGWLCMGAHGGAPGGLGY